jgi:hypothetical protein
MDTYVAALIAALRQYDHLVFDVYEDMELAGWPMHNSMRELVEHAERVSEKGLLEDMP